MISRKIILLALGASLAFGVTAEAASTAPTSPMTTAAKPASKLVATKTISGKPVATKSVAGQSASGKTRLRSTALTRSHARKMRVARRSAKVVASKPIVKKTTIARGVGQRKMATLRHHRVRIGHAHFKRSHLATRTHSIRTRLAIRHVKHTGTKHV